MLLGSSVGNFILVRHIAGEEYKVSGKEKKSVFLLLLDAEYGSSMVILVHSRDSVKVCCSVEYKRCMYSCDAISNKGVT